MTVFVSERASRQIDKAAHWFFEQNPGLETAINYIQKNPLKCQTRYKSVRIKFLKKFTFGVHYIIENETIFILYVFHTSQDRDDWL